MKLKVFLFAMCLPLSSSLSSEEITLTHHELTHEQCAGIALDILDIGYKRKLAYLEYESNVYLYNAAQSMIQKNALAYSHARDREEFSISKKEENDKLVESVAQFNKKIIGADSVITVLTGEIDALKVRFQNGSCESMEKALEVAPLVCEKIGKLNKACHFMWNASVEPPEL
jgi:hypothetical protein